jgi:hypothetical protein
MLVQGVVRVLQSRAKEGKGELLVANLAEEFKTLWKVPFNLQSAGYTDINTFLKAWPNKFELTSLANGDIVALAKKPAEKAKEAELPIKAVVTAAKSVTLAGGATAQKAAPPNPSALAPPKAPAAAKVAASLPPASPASPASESADGVESEAPIPQGAAEIRKELARNVQELEVLAKRQESLVDRQKALVEALDRVHL